MLQRVLLLWGCAMAITMAHAMEPAHPAYPIDVIRADDLGRFVVIVGDVPAYEQGKDVRTVTVERILWGPNMAVGTKTPIRFNPRNPQTIEGKHILFLTYDADTLIWGYTQVSIGRISDAYPVKSANDPEVFDVQVMIDTAAIRIPGLKYARLQDLTVRMAHRPLVLQYVIAAQMAIRDDIVQSTNGYLWFILTHPEDHPPATLILADKLLSKTEMNIVQSKDPQWSVSKYRKTVFEQLDKDLPKNDPDRPYVERVLRSFAPPAPEK